MWREVMVAQLHPALVPGTPEFMTQMAALKAAHPPGLDDAGACAAWMRRMHLRT